MKPFLAILLLSLAHISFSQNETANWFLGGDHFTITQKEGLTAFSSSPADWKLFRSPSSVSFSDASGRLVFATNGRSVINSNNEIIYGSLDAMGVLQAVPAPGSPGVYYLFYNKPEDIWKFDGGLAIRYALVDISANEGKGAVTSVDNMVGGKFSRGYTISMIPGTDQFWIVAHKFATDSFFCYKVNASGVSSTPVKQRAGAHPNQLQYRFDFLRTSPDGNMIAGYVSPLDYTMSFGAGRSFLEVFNFDPSSGMLASKIISIPEVVDQRSEGSVEFSPSGRLVYVSRNLYVNNNSGCDILPGGVMQYNLCYTDPKSFSEYAIRISPVTWCYGAIFSTMQLGADRRIYTPLSGFLSTISYPNRIGKSSTFKYYDYRLTSPSNVSTIFNHHFIAKAVRNNIIYNARCFPEPMYFSISNDTIGSVRWNFGDPSGADNEWDGLTARHHFSAPGIYTVTAKLYTRLGELIETVTDDVEIKDPNQRLLYNYSADTTLCANEVLQLDVSAINAIFRWYVKTPSGQIKNDTICDNFWSKESGTWYVEMRQNECDGCIMRDSIQVRYIDVPDPNLGDNRMMCQGDSVLLSVADEGWYYQWSTGDIGPQLMAKEPGEYSIKVVNAFGCEAGDTVKIDVHPLFNFELPSDTSLCDGDKLILEVNVPGTTALWNGSISGSRFELDQPGEYRVLLANTEGCEKADSISVRYMPRPRTDLGNDTSICYGKPFTIGKRSEGVQYTWHDGSSAAWFKVQAPGRYWVTAVMGSCSSSDTIVVQAGDCPSGVPNAFTPNADGKNDEFKAPGYAWAQEFRLTVYNRWGQLIFVSNDAFRGWDGRYKGKPQEAGNYLWTITFKDENGISMTQKGAVLLIR